MISLIEVQGRNLNDNIPIHYLKWTRKDTITTEKLAKGMSRKSSSFTRGEIGGVTLDIPDYICDELLAGNAIRIDGLGTFKLKIKAISAPTSEPLSLRGAEIKDVIFTPDTDFFTRLKKEARFEIVNQTTDEGAQDKDDNTTDPDNPSSGTGTDTNTPTPPADGTSQGGTKDDNFEE